MSNSVVIPQDIIDSIIDTVRFDRTLLEKCALVSSSFLLPSRKHLFSEIHPRNDRACRRLHQLLVTNPVIQSFVRHFTFIWDPRSSMSDHLPLNPTSLIAILRLPYSCLESFSIQMSGRHPKWNWNDFSSELKDAISSFIHLPTLQTLSLDNIDMPITLLQGIHLTTLELSEISPKGLDAKQSSLLTPEGMETTAPQDMVIDQCLWYFFYKPVRERLTEPIFLPFVCRLRVFDITVHLDSPTILMMDSDVLSFLMRSLHLSLTSPAALEHLKFGIIFNGKGNLDHNAFYDDLRGADVWRHLDSIITLPAGSRLQRVDIDIDYEFRCDNDVAELDDTKILEVMLDALPLLREKGILSCSSTFYLNYRSLTRFGGVEVKWSRCQC